MSCVYTYNGVNYSYAELAAALHGGLLEKLVTDGKVRAEPDNTTEEVRVETDEELSNPLKDVESATKALEGKITDKVEASIGVLYHGTKEDFDEFDEKKAGKTDDGWYGKGIYFHTNKDRGAYGDIVKSAVVKLKNPIVLPVENAGAYLYDIVGKEAGLGESFRDKSAMAIIREIGSDKFTEIAKKLNYDGVEVNYAQGTKEVVSFDKSNIQTITPKFLAEAYHKAKQDGSNPELVKAVEELITNENIQDATKITGAESVDVGEPSRNGKKVGEGNAQKEEVAEKEEEKEVVSPTEQVEQPAEFEEVKQAKEKFYKHTEDKGYVEVKRAKPVYIFGTEKAFYVKEGKEFVVSDAITGAEIGRGSTLNNAVASAEENAGSVQNLESARERFTDAYGKSPYAKLQEEFSFTQSIINNAMDMADVVENEALKDVEGTAQALENVDYDNILANVPAISISNKQEMIGERLKKIKSIKEKAEGTREWRAKKYNEFKDKYGEGKAIEYLNKEIKDIADLEISKLPPIPKSEYEIIDEKGSRDFSKIVKDLGFKESGLSWGGSPFDEEVGMVLRNQDDTAAIFIKPNDIDFYDEIEDTQEDITNGIRIELLVTKSEKRGLGLAKNLLKKVTDWADKNNADLFLTIAPQDELTTGDGLKKLYESFGFEFKGIEGERINSDKLKIAEAYHKAKADGSNPELVKAVEDLLGGDNTNAYLDIMEDKGIIKKECE